MTGAAPARAGWPASSAATSRRLTGRASLRAVAAGAGLVALVAAGGWMAVAAAADDAFVDTAAVDEPSWAHGVLSGLLPGLGEASFSALLLIMLAGYALAAACAEALPARVAVAAVGVLIVAFALAPPILSSDVFGYLAYARLDVVHGLNPYLHGPIEAPHDPVLPLVYWQHPSSPYGPLFTLLSLPLAAVSVPVAVWSTKALTALACLVAVLLLARAAPRYARSPARAAVLVGGNPLLLAYGVGGGHNDLLVMAATAGAILLLAGERARAGGAALVLAAGLKVSGGLALGFACLAHRKRSGFATGALTAAAATAAVAVVAFGGQLGGTVGQIATSRHFVMAWSGPDVLGRLLGTGVTAGVRLACAVGAAGVVATCLWRVRRGGDWLGESTLAGLAVLCAIPSLVPWYVAWVLPAAAVARGRGAWLGVLALTALITATHLPLLGFDAY